MAEALRVQGLTPTEKLVLIGIANHAGDGGSWPATATLAIYASASERTVQRAVTVLANRGLITVHKNQGGNAKTRADRRPNLYSMHLDGATRVSTRSDGDGATAEPSPGDTESERGDTTVLDGVTQLCHPNHPEPSIEPPVVEPGVELSLVAGTPDQQAKVIVDGYWKWYREQHGTDPVVGFMAYRGIVARSIKAGHEARAVKAAMVAMHDAGIPLSAEALDRQLTRPAARPNRPKPKAVDDDRDGDEGKVSGW